MMSRKLSLSLLSLLSLWSVNASAATEHFYLPTEVNFGFYEMEADGSETSLTFTMNFSYEQDDIRVISAEAATVDGGRGLVNDNSAQLGGYMDSLSISVNTAGVEYSYNSNDESFKSDLPSPNYYSIGLDYDPINRSYDASEHYFIFFKYSLVWIEPWGVFVIGANHIPDDAPYPPDVVGMWGEAKLVYIHGQYLSTSIPLVNISQSLEHYSLETSEVPVPAAAWLFGSALMTLMLGNKRRR